LPRMTASRAVVSICAHHNRLPAGLPTPSCN
jgi:hypothetical protein